MAASIAKLLRAGTSSIGRAYRTGEPLYQPVLRYQGVMVWRAGQDSWLTNRDAAHAAARVVRAQVLPWLQNADCPYCNEDCLTPEDKRCQHECHERTP